MVSEYFWKSKVEVLHWSGHSPDLNPIKNLWSYIKYKLAENQPSRAKEPVTAIKKVLAKEISTECCAFLIKVCPAVLLQ